MGSFGTAVTSEPPKGVVPTKLSHLYPLPIRTAMGPWTWGTLVLPLMLRLISQFLFAFVAR